MRARGVDVSSVQNEQDPDRILGWSTLAEGGFDFGIVKGTTGARGRDPFLEANVHGARAAGLLVPAVYHVLTVETSPADQAKNALDAILPLDTRIAVDFESPPPERWGIPFTGPQLVARLLSFVRICTLAGAQVIVYSYDDFLERILATLAAAAPERAALALLDWWFARYFHEKKVPAENVWPTMPTGLPRAKFWQWSGNRGTAAPGISSVVDHDLFDGTREELIAWMKGDKSEGGPGTGVQIGPAA